MTIAQLALIFFLLAGVFLGCPYSQDNVAGQQATVETSFDAARNVTTVKMGRLKIGGENGKYHSLYTAISFKYPGQNRRIPELLTFELITVVKARRLKIDMQVQFLVDGEKIFLSSNRWAEKNPVPGKPWISEHIDLRMPFEIFDRITKAKEVVIQMDAVKFTVENEELRAFRDFKAYINAN